MSACFVIFEAIWDNNRYTKTYSRRLGRGFLFIKHGFFARLTTKKTSLFYSVYIVEFIETGSQVGVFYTEFSKEFDQIDHGILLIIVSPPLVFWMLYLRNRRYRSATVIANTSSEFLASFGVLQYYNIGPLPYLLCMNGISFLVDGNKLNMLII